MIWPELTEADLRAARAFRRFQRAALAASVPPGMTVSVFARQVRHPCAKLGGRSVNLEMHEHYVLSPQYLVWKTGAAVPEDWPEQADGPLEADIPAGRFGFIFTQGRCSACGMTARSGDSRLVDPRIRPPSPHAVVTGQADYAGRER